MEVNGKRYDNVEFEVLLGYFHAVMLRYQLAKVAGDRLELRIIPTDEYTDADAEKIRRAFQEKFGWEPEIKTVEYIQPTPAGKTKFIIDETASALDSTRRDKER